MRKSISKFSMECLARIEFLSYALASVVLLFMIAASTVDVLMRDLLNSPLPGVVELQIMCIIIFVYIGLPYVQASKSNICLDLLVDRLKPSLQIAAQAFGYIICMISFGILCWRSGVDAYRSTVIHEYVQGLINYPIYPVKWVITVGSGFFVMSCLRDTVIGLDKLRRMHKSGVTAKEVAE